VDCSIDCFSAHMLEVESVFTCITELGIHCLDIADAHRVIKWLVIWAFVHLRIFTSEHICIISVDLQYSTLLIANLEQVAGDQIRIFIS
jgi:hypothetical protein